MAETRSPHSVHTARLHRARDRAAAARAALDTAVTDTVTAHYAARAAATPQTVSSVPRQASGQQVPPPSP